MKTAQNNLFHLEPFFPRGKFDSKAHNFQEFSLFAKLKRVFSTILRWWYHVVGGCYQLLSIKFHPENGKKINWDKNGLRGWFVGRGKGWERLTKANRKGTENKNKFKFIFPSPLIFFPFFFISILFEKMSSFWVCWDFVLSSKQFFVGLGKRWNFHRFLLILPRLQNNDLRLE